MSLKNIILSAISALAILSPTEVLGLSCNGDVSDLNFGTISVRSGVLNQTSGVLDIQCTDALVSAVGICVEFGAGSGGSANASLSPRYLRGPGGFPLAYELRPTGYGPSHGTLQRIFVTIPVIGGQGNASIPIYAEITDNGSGLAPGSYQSIFGLGSVNMTYGILSCGLLGQTANVGGFAVSGTVGSSCDVDTSGVAFGTLPFVIDHPYDAVGSVNVTCTDGTGYSVRLDMGTGPNVTEPNNRRMTAGASTLTYGLYQDQSRTAPWGNTIANDISMTGNGSTQTLPVYGRVHSGQTVEPGQYNDSVTVIVEY